MPGVGRSQIRFSAGAIALFLFSLIFSSLLVGQTRPLFLQIAQRAEVNELRARASVQFVPRDSFFVEFTFRRDLTQFSSSDLRVAQALFDLDLALGAEQMTGEQYDALRSVQDQLERLISSDPSNAVALAGLAVVLSANEDNIGEAIDALVLSFQNGPWAEKAMLLRLRSMAVLWDDAPEDAQRLAIHNAAAFWLYRDRHRVSRIVPMLPISARNAIGVRVDEIALEPTDIRRYLRNIERREAPAAEPD